MKKKVINAVIFGIIILGFVLFVWLQKISHKIFLPNGTTASSSHSLAARFANKQPFTILLLGYSGDKDADTYLTDTIVAAHIDPKGKKIVLLSIPRDLFVQIPTNGTDGKYWKINAAYELGLDDTDYPNKQDKFKGQAGGGNMAKYVITQVAGLQIDNFVALDFTGFKRTIAALGGVEVNVETTFDDYQYPIEGKINDTCGHTDAEVGSLSAQLASPDTTITELDAFPCRYEHLHFEKGLQHMDGERALKYVRSRHSLQDGSDFGRSKRQRNVILAAEQKVFSIGFIPKIIPFINSLQDDARTDLTPEDAQTLITHASELKEYSIKTLALTTDNFLVNAISDDGQAILQPQDGKNNFASINNWVASYTDSTAVLTLPIIQVANASGVVGLAEHATNRLKGKNYNVLPPITVNNQIQQKTTIVLYNRKIDKKILSDLTNEFGTKTIEEKTSDTVSSDILITIGKDYSQKQVKN